MCCWHFAKLNCTLKNLLNPISPTDKARVKPIYVDNLGIMLCKVDASIRVHEVLALAEGRQTLFCHNFAHTNEGSGITL